MKGKWLILFLALVILPAWIVYAKPTSTIIKIDNISDEALQMVKLQRYDDAKKLLEYFSEQFLADKENETVLPVNDLRIISVAHREALEAMTSPEIPHNEKMNRVTKFRLVIDAVSSGHQPLWTEMEDPIMSVFQNVRKAATNGDNENFHSQLNSFLSLYSMIHPSMVIDIPEEQIQSLDEKVSFVDHYRPKVLKEAENQQELEALGTELQNIFDEMTEDEADPSLWWVMISTGSIIILTLSYVGWRKYKGSKEQEQNRPKTQKD
jgi:sporulation protein YpjB